MRCKDTNYVHAVQYPARNTTFGVMGLEVGSYRLKGFRLVSYPANASPSP